MKKIISLILTIAIVFNISLTGISVLGETNIVAELPGNINLTLDQLIFSESFSENSVSGYRKMYPEFTATKSYIKNSAWHIEGEAATNSGLLNRNISDFIAVFECSMKSKYDTYHIAFHAPNGWPGIADSYISIVYNSDNRSMSVSLCVEGTVYTDDNLSLRYGTSYSFGIVSIGRDISLYVWKTVNGPSTTPLFTVTAESAGEGDFYFYSYNGVWDIGNISIYEPTVTPYLAGKLLYDSTGYSLDENDITYRNDFAASIVSPVQLFDCFDGTQEIYNHSLHIVGETASQTGLTENTYREFMVTWDFSCYTTWTTNIFYFGADSGWPTGDEKGYLKLRHIENDGGKMAVTLNFENNSVSTESMYFYPGKVYHIALIAARETLILYAWEKATSVPEESLLILNVDEIPFGDFYFYTYQADTFIDNITVYDLSSHIAEPTDDIFNTTGMALGWDELIVSYETVNTGEPEDFSDLKQLDDFIVAFKLPYNQQGDVCFDLGEQNKCELFRIKCTNGIYEIATTLESKTVKSLETLNVVCTYSQNEGKVYAWHQGEAPPSLPTVTLQSAISSGYLTATGNITIKDYRLYDTFFKKQNTYEKPKITNAEAYYSYPSGILFSCEQEQITQNNYRCGFICAALEGANYNGCFTSYYSGKSGMVDISALAVSENQKIEWSGIATGNIENITLMARGYINVVDSYGVEHTLYSDKYYISPVLIEYKANIFGDCNYDNVIDIRDLIRLKKKTSENAFFSAGDFNADGKLAADDLIGMRMVLLDVNNEILTGGVNFGRLKTETIQYNAKKLCFTENDRKLPQGVFLITEPLVIESGNLRGAGKGKTVIVADFQDKDLPIIYAGGTPVISDLTICYRDGLVTGNEQQGERVGIYTTKVWPLQKGACIRNVEIRNTGTGIFSDKTKNGIECMAFSVMFDKVSICDFSFRGFDFISQLRTGNIYSDIEISSGKYNCDSAFYFGYDNYECEESETTLDSLTVYDTVAKLPISFGGARALVADKIIFDNVTATSGTFIDWNHSSGVIESLTLKNSPLVENGILISIGETDFINWNSLNYLRINELVLEQMRGSANGFKLFNRAEGLTDEYYIAVNEYRYSSDVANSILDAFPVSENLIFTKKGSELKESRLCPFYSKKQDEYGNILCWTGTSWQ